MKSPGSPHALQDHSYGQELTHRHATGVEYDHDHDDFESFGPLEENPIWIQDHVSLISVGIDIGSSGTQVIFSRVNLRRLGEDLSEPLFRGVPRDPVPVTGRAHAVTKASSASINAPWARSSTPPTTPGVSTPRPSTPAP